MNTNGVYPTLDDVRDILSREGHHPILLPVHKGRKNPINEHWNKISYLETLEPEYQKTLETCTNTGVVMGGEDNLCGIDYDTNAFMNRMQELNPVLEFTLTTVGMRAGTSWLYVEGERPHKVEYLKVRKDSPLAAGAKKVNADGTVTVGEFRAEGGQTIVRGVHPDGPRYRWIDKSQPLTIDFSEIVWPEDVIIPWGKNRRSSQSTTGSKKNDDLLQRAIAALSINKLWEHFNYPARNGNPVCSPFREDRTPSFSIYDEGRRWRDHGNGEHGDSYDFYQKVTGQDSKTAFVGFIELAGLGHELKGARYSASGASTPETGAARAGVNQDRGGTTARHQLILPSGAVKFIECAGELFPILAKRHKYFVRDRILVEIACQKELKDEQKHDVFQILEPDAFRSRLEAEFDLFVWREERGSYVLKPGRCSGDTARVLLKTEAAFEHLPSISFLSAQPVLTVIEGETKILYRGYHDVHGGIYVVHGDETDPIILPDLDTAVGLLLEAVADYDFVTPSDKSRAIASFISPALRKGRFLGDVDFPIDISEADKSQSGKTYQLKLICALYGEMPYIISNRKGGVGSLDESVSNALIAGVPFIVIENFRNKLDSELLETCLRGTGYAPARIPHRGEVQVSTRHINWHLSSNGLEVTGDLANRSIINRISKRPDGYSFARYPEGDILAHIKANQLAYLGAVFRIIGEWHSLGCPRTAESRHDFTDWAQCLDWIVQNICKLAPLIDGHVEEKKRISDPVRSWVRQIAIAIEKEDRLDLVLAASDIVDICQSHGIDFPNKIVIHNQEYMSFHVGRLMAPLFRDINPGDAVKIDRYEVRRELKKIYRNPSQGGGFTQNTYLFSRGIK